MKVQLVFKTPDVIDQISDFNKESEEYKQVECLIQKYVRYGEIICVEFDGETGEVRVMPA